MEKERIVVIIGPTASGKSGLAVHLAELFNGEIISADSMQVYKFMDIGTAKPDASLRKRAAHHLIDIVEPDCGYSAARFMFDAMAKIEEIRSRGKNAFVAGGTGLYIKALTEGLFEGPEGDKTVRDELLREALIGGRDFLYMRLKEVDPAAAASIHPNNLRRVVRALEVYEISRRPISEFHKEHAFSESRYDALKIGLVKERALLYSGIDKRVDEMMRAGLLEETRRLINAGYAADLKPMQALGYREMSGCLRGDYTLEEAVRLLKRNTRHYAKRQLTWFRKDPDIRWFSPGQKDDIIETVKRHLK